MANSFEWLVIRVETLYKILVIAVIVLALGIGWWLLHRVDPEHALKEAQQRYAEVSARVAKVKDDCDPSLKPKMSEAFDALARANDAIKSGEVETALAESGKAMAIADRMADECSGPNRATVVAVNGAAEVKKADRPDYEPLKRNMRVDPGDVIRTGSGSQVVIKFPDETLQSISADTLFQIRSFERTGNGFSFSGEIKEGGVDVTRPASSSIDNRIQIQTQDDVQASLAPGSRVAAQVGPGGTEVAVVTGTATVDHGGLTTTVQQGTKITAADASAPLVSAKIPRPPTQLTPADQQVINAETGESPELLFTWTASEGVRNYKLQLGRDPFMSEPLMADVLIPGATQSRIKLPKGGANYYWRVRADDSTPGAAPKSPPGSAPPPPRAPTAIENTLWSFVYGFRVMERQAPNPNACAGGATGPGCTPLEVNCTLNPLSWDTVIVTCNTTPGLSLTIDDIGCELVDGRCRKIKTFSSAGNQQILVKVFDNYGNEKPKILVYKVIPQ